MVTYLFINQERNKKLNKIKNKNNKNNKIKIKIYKYYDLNLRNETKAHSCIE